MPQIINPGSQKHPKQLANSLLPYLPWLNLYAESVWAPTGSACSIVLYYMRAPVFPRVCDYRIHLVVRAITFTLKLLVFFVVTLLSLQHWRRCYFDSKEERLKLRPRGEELEDPDRAKTIAHRFPTLKKWKFTNHILNSNTWFRVFDSQQNLGQTVGEIQLNLRSSVIFSTHKNQAKVA